MKAVILAAGIGSRLRPITLKKPKAAVTVDGMSILEHQISAYTQNGINDIYIVTGYKADYIRKLCKNITDRINANITILENKIYANTENMYSLFMAEEAVRGEDFFLSNGDVVFRADVIKRMVGDPTNVSKIGIDNEGYIEEAMKVTKNSEGNLNKISKSISEQKANAVSIDVYKFTSEFSEDLFANIEYRFETQEDYSGWTEKAINRILEKEQFPVHGVAQPRSEWVEIDDLEDLSLADKVFSKDIALDAKKAIFFDCDGTLYLDEEPISGAIELIRNLEKADVDVYYMSNNSSKWKDDYVEGLSEIGLSVSSEQILLSTDGVINYLVENEVEDSYVVGTKAMRKAIESAGINPVSEDPTHVIIGFDTELTYEKVRQATISIQKGARFLVAHSDVVCPTKDGMVPDCGSISALVESATSQLPSQTFGKPNREMITGVLDSKGYSPEDIVIVGDRLRTDIQLAKNINCDSVCVLTGDANRIDIEEDSIQPTATLNSVAELNEIYFKDQENVEAVVDY